MAESLGLNTQTFAFDNLVGDNYPVTTEEATILSGQTPTARGAIVAQAVAGAITSAAVVGTGNGTIGTLSNSAGVQAGAYTAVCVKAVTNAGDFEVRNPQGVLIGIATTGVAFTSNEINFTIADGSTDFALGDLFTITVAAGTLKYKKYNAANTDGSGNVANAAIVATTVDATSADRVTNVYTSGVFNSAALVGYTAGMKAGLAAKGIRVVTNEAL